jgi:pimeloyl-ACP methyl ester carboxylesterase
VETSFERHSNSPIPSLHVYKKYNKPDLTSLHHTDLWGRGYTESPHVPHTSRLLALQLLFAASSSPLNWCSQTFSIVGFSLGGSITLDFTASFPHLVRSVALIAPAGLLRTLPREYEDLKNATRDGASGEVLRGLVKEALGVADGDGDGEMGFERLVRWQFERHDGHVGSFASTLLYGPVQGQGEVWKGACEVLKGKRSKGGERLVVVCGAEDDVVKADDVREDLKGFMGGGEEGELLFETLPGGHGLLADERVCRNVVQILGREWGI